MFKYLIHLFFSFLHALYIICVDIGVAFCSTKPGLPTEIYKILGFHILALFPSREPDHTLPRLGRALGFGLEVLLPSWRIHNMLCCLLQAGGQCPPPRED